MPRSIALTIAALSLSGCIGQQAAMDAHTVGNGQNDYEALCAACHGVSGQGDGPAATGLDRPPADLTTLSARNGGTFPMLEVMARVDGYNSDTDNMPEFGQVFDEPLVPFETEPGIFTPTPPELIALADYVATLQR